MHEAQFHEENCFITLTYEDSKLPKDSELDHGDWQRFAKAMRDRGIRFRYLMCGEYGEKQLRPHFHALIFGFAFPDRYHWQTNNGHPLYRSPMLEACWPHGFSTIGSLTPETAAYVAAYVYKKWDADPSDYTKVDWETGEVLPLRPPYLQASRRPGLGHEWFKKYYRDLAKGFVIFEGKKRPIPQYYLKLLERYHPDVLESLSDKFEAYRDSSEVETGLRLSQREDFYQAVKAPHKKRNVDYET